MKFKVDPIKRQIFSGHSAGFSVVPEPVLIILLYLFWSHHSRSNRDPRNDLRTRKGSGSILANGPKNYRWGNQSGAMQVIGYSNIIDPILYALDLHILSWQIPGICNGKNGCKWVA